MFLFRLAAYAVCLWFFPWWGPWDALVVVTGAFAAVRPHTWSEHARLSLSGALAWVALAAAEDLANADLVSKRLSTLFSLPRAWITFPTLATVIFLTVFLLARAVGSWRKFN